MTPEHVKKRSTIPGRGGRLPLFSGMSPSGDDVRLHDFYLRRNLALVFTHGPECEQCQQVLRDLVTIRPAVRNEAGEILVVASGMTEGMADLPYPLVVDAGNEIHRHYGLVDGNGDTWAAIFLADRYGVVFETSIATDEHTMLPVQEVPGWMEFIACRCS